MVDTVSKEEKNAQFLAIHWIRRTKTWLIMACPKFRDLADATADEEMRICSS